jgi:hypothetical protein
VLLLVVVLALLLVVVAVEVGVGVGVFLRIVVCGAHLQAPLEIKLAMIFPSDSMRVVGIAIEELLQEMPTLPRTPPRTLLRILLRTLPQRRRVLYHRQSCYGFTFSDC